ncbi:MAG: hypothetical protein ACOC46_00605 [Pirellulales bacterium]
MADGYPQRAPFFAHRFVRLLTKTATAQQIGPEACWLLSIIAHQEDAIHYRHPIRYWNEQLGALCGFGSRKRLVSARRRAVDARWLVYHEGGKGRPGVYWVEVPAEYRDLPDGPCDESDATVCRSDSERKPEHQTESRSDSSRKPERQAPANRNGKGTPFNPDPSPIPVPKKRAPKARPEDTELPAALATDAFRRAWSDWIGYRRDRRLTLTARTLSQQLKALAAMGESGAIASIEASIKNGWQGLFGPHKGTAKNARSRYADGPGQVHPDTPRRF